jgi:hypothetical protein
MTDGKWKINALQNIFLNVTLQGESVKRLRKHIIASITIITAAFVFAAILTVGAQSTNVTGNWKLTIETPNGSGGPSLVLKQEKEELTGTYKGRFGDTPLKGTVKGKDIKFTTKVSAQGQDILVEYEGTVDGDTMKGKVKFGEMGEGTFTGKKE